MYYFIRLNINSILKKAGYTNVLFIHFTAVPLGSIPARMYNIIIVRRTWNFKC